MHKALFRLLSGLVLVFALDWLTKVWAEQTLVLYQPLPILGQFFRLTLGYNTGVAFGMFANGGVWPLVIAGVVIFGLMIWFIRTLQSAQLPPLAAWSIGFLLGGAMANFVDRLLDGHVTDFLDVGVGATRWPTFNLADSFIVIGLILFTVITTISDHKRVETTDQPDHQPMPEGDELANS